MVLKECKSEIGLYFEEDFLQYMQEKRERTKRRNSNKNIYEVCRHDLWAVDDDINDVSAAAAILKSGHYKISNRII